MIDFIKKLSGYGFRKAFTVIVIRSLNSFKVLLYRLVFSDNSPKNYGSEIHLPTQFVGKGSIDLIGCQLGVWPSPNFLNGAGYMEARAESARIHIGYGTKINNNFKIIADKKNIKIGQRCLIGHDLFVTDSDFHGLSVESRNLGEYVCEDVVIGDDVFIGAHVIILKGVVIGSGAVIGSGSLVASNVDCSSMYAGNPARKIRII